MMRDHTKGVNTHSVLYVNSDNECRPAYGSFIVPVFDNVVFKVQTV